MDIKEFKTNDESNISQDAKTLFNIRNCITAMAILAVIATAVVIGIFVRSQTFNMWDYIDVTYTGADGYASPVFTVYKERLFYALLDKKVADKIVHNSDGSDDISALTAAEQEKAGQIRKLVNSISVKCEKTDISNGDSYKVKVIYNTELSAELKKDLGKEDYKLKASGIDEGTEVNLLDGVEVTFAGISPEAYVKISNNWEDDYLKTLVFTADRTEHIAFDDKIVVSCDVTFEDAARHGYLIAQRQATYKADMLANYATEYGQVSMEMLTDVRNAVMNNITTETEDTTYHMLYRAYKDSTYLKHTNTETADNMKVENVYFLSKKGRDGEYENYLYMLVSADITDLEASEKVYFAYEFTGVYVNVDNTSGVSVENLGKKYTCSGNLQTLYEEKIAAKAGEYGIYEINF